MSFPTIDYALLGRAVHHYQSIGYEYVEVPWSVDQQTMLATCPDNSMTFMMEVSRFGERAPIRPLVASAEQGFLALDLPPGQYVGCTPCFRVEEKHDLFTQPWFMKVELYDNRDDPDFGEVLMDATLFMQSVTANPVVPIATDIGFDLTIGGIEVGSYGVRSVDGFRPWAYGTGLALPRFSTARNLADFDRA